MQMLLKLRHTHLQLITHVHMDSFTLRISLEAGLSQLTTDAAEFHPCRQVSEVIYMVKHT